eukprot:jgi/Mesvir1/19508/Mv16605-RA.1
MQWKRAGPSAISATWPSSAPSNAGAKGKELAGMAPGSSLVWQRDGTASTAEPGWNAHSTGSGWQLPGTLSALKRAGPKVSRGANTWHKPNTSPVADDGGQLVCKLPGGPASDGAAFVGNDVLHKTCYAETPATSATAVASKHTWTKGSASSLPGSRGHGAGQPPVPSSSTAIPAPSASRTWHRETVANPVGNTPQPSKATSSTGVPSPPVQVAKGQLGTTTAPRSASALSAPAPAPRKSQAAAAPHAVAARKQAMKYVRGAADSRDTPVGTTELSATLPSSHGPSGTVHGNAAAQALPRSQSLPSTCTSSNVVAAASAGDSREPGIAAGTWASTPTSTAAWPRPGPAAGAAAAVGAAAAGMMTMMASAPPVTTGASPVPAATPVGYQRRKANQLVMRRDTAGYKLKSKHQLVRRTGGAAASPVARARDRSQNGAKVGPAGRGVTPSPRKASALTPNHAVRKLRLMQAYGQGRARLQSSSSTQWLPYLAPQKKIAKVKSSNWRAGLFSSGTPVVSKVPGQKLALLYAKSGDGFTLQRAGVRALGKGGLFGPGSGSLHWTSSIAQETRLKKEAHLQAKATVAKLMRDAASGNGGDETKGTRRGGHAAATAPAVGRKRKWSTLFLSRDSGGSVGAKGPMRTPRRFRYLRPKDSGSPQTPASKLSSATVRASQGREMGFRLRKASSPLKAAVRYQARLRLARSFQNVLRRKVLRKKDELCMFFTRFGKCNTKDKGECPYVHDPDKVAVCTRWLKGACDDEACPLTHKVMPERMPVCSYFLEGLCNSESCPYRHVKVNPAAAVCKEFLRGYCPEGDQCRLKHTFICPEWEACGMCKERSTCRLHHPRVKGSNAAGSSHSRQGSRQQNEEAFMAELGAGMVTSAADGDGEGVRACHGDLVIPAFLR